MWDLTKRKSLRTTSVLSKVEPEPDLSTGSDQKVPAPTDSGSATLVTGCIFLLKELAKGEKNLLDGKISTGTGCGASLKPPSTSTESPPCLYLSYPGRRWSGRRAAWRNWADCCKSLQPSGLSPSSQASLEYRPSRLVPQCPGSSGKFHLCETLLFLVE